MELILLQENYWCQPSECAPEMFPEPEPSSKGAPQFRMRPHSWWLCWWEREREFWIVVPRLAARPDCWRRKIQTEALSLWNCMLTGRACSKLWFQLRLLK